MFTYLKSLTILDLSVSIRKNISYCYEVLITDPFR